MLQSVIELVAPVRCVFCRKRKELFCREHFPAPRVNQLQQSQLSGYILAELDQSLWKLISAFKDQSMTALGKVLAELLQPLIQTELWQGSDVIVIAPSSPKAYRSRGFVPVRLMLSKAGQTKPVVSLTLNRKIKDQRSLSAAERKLNLSGAYSANALSGKRVLLFDDVLTTGTTLEEMNRAVVQAGGEVLGFCVLARRIADFDKRLPN